MMSAASAQLLRVLDVHNIAQGKLGGKQIITTNVASVSFCLGWHCDEIN